MRQAPFDDASIRRIGSVHHVAPDEIIIFLDTEAPSSVALNTGTPHPFPRVNGYVLVPVDGGYLVGQIGMITIEPATHPKRKGMSDFGIIDLPYPARKMQIFPIGMLQWHSTDKDGNSTHDFERGVRAFPSVGADVLLPEKEQLNAIIRAGNDGEVKIGTCPLADNADVVVNPNRLFGRHLAILGNTGSGKSCSVAGLIKWSIRAAEDKCGKNPNARFIILDPNGEYASAFTSQEKSNNVKVFSISNNPDHHPIRVPMRFWNAQEWISFLQAAPKVQVPALIEWVRGARIGGAVLSKGIAESFDESGYEKEIGGSSKNQHTATLVTRMDKLLADEQMRSVIRGNEPKLTKWLDDYIGSGKDSDNPSVSIIDLSMLPMEILHMSVTIIARMIFEALQRYRKVRDEILPTVLVLEEAHYFVNKHDGNAETQTAAGGCRQAFEKIAREGRKFGLGLVVSSQRPSELSPTVLSQCNSFLIHRITNPHDQDTVKYMVSDNLRGLMKELPSLPSQHAILLGWASELPVFVKINDLPEQERPKSADPDFWKVWTHQEKRKPGWSDIAKKWEGK